MSNYLIIGATSLIAQKYCELIVQQGGKVYLVARDEEKLDVVKMHLSTLSPGSIIGSFCCDLNEQASYEHALHEIFRDRAIHTTLISAGMLGNMIEAENNTKRALEIINTNYVSIVALLIRLSHLYELQGFGSIAVITSVAGERGRISNYIYGSSKGGLSIFLSGLRLKMLRFNVFVTDLKLGPVFTPMTAHLKRNFLWTNPSSVAKTIDHCIKTRKPVCYIPFYWRWIMLIIKLLPDFLFKRLKV